MAAKFIYFFNVKKSQIHQTACSITRKIFIKNIKNVSLLPPRTPLSPLPPALVLIVLTNCIQVVGKYSLQTKINNNRTIMPSKRRSSHHKPNPTDTNTVSFFFVSFERLVVRVTVQVQPSTVQYGGGGGGGSETPHAVSFVAEKTSEAGDLSPLFKVIRSLLPATTRRHALHKCVQSDCNSPYAIGRFPSCSSSSSSSSADIAGRAVAPSRRTDSSS